MSLVKELFKDIMPEFIVNKLRSNIRSRKIGKIKSHGQISKNDFIFILEKKLKLKPGNNVLVHSSLDFLDIDFSPVELIDILISFVGEDGTLVMPAFTASSYDFILKNKVFNVNRTPSESGLITELFRRRSGTVRSLHPTKSVVSMGPLSNHIVKDHDKNLLPFGRNSPFYKMIERDFLSIGLGVSTSKMSIAHCVEDDLGADFPVPVYHDKLFDIECIDADGNNCSVSTYAHNMYRMNFKVEKYLKKYYSDNVDIQYKGRNFFSVSSKAVYNNMLQNAKKGVTMYPYYSYKFSRLIG